MMHEWFELTIPQVVALPTPEFLERCGEYLEAALTQEQQREVDRKASAYGRKYLGMTPEDEYNWHLGL